MSATPNASVSTPNVLAPNVLATNVLAPNMLVPNVVICGVRKCGTTALFRWLQSHPDVCASSAKETQFLMDRDSPYYDPEFGVHDVGIGGYAHFFGEWSGERFRMEASSRYYDQETALKVLSALDEPPHVVFIVREPVERLESAFHYAKNNRGTLREDVTLAQFVAAASNGDVRELLAISIDSKLGQSVRNEVSQLAKEVDYGHYARRLAHWRDRYPRDRLHVLRFEDLRNDPQQFVQALAARMELDPSFYEDFAFRKENRTVAMRNLRVHRMMRRLAQFVPRNSWTRAAYGLYLKVQGRPAAKLATNKATGDDTRQQLRALYASSNQELAAMFDLDLTAWNERSAAQPTA